MPPVRSHTPALIAITLLVFVSAAAPMWSLPSAVGFLVWPAAMILPGYAVVRRGEGPRAGSLGLAAGAGPVLFGIVVTLFGLLGLPAAVGALVAVVAGGAAAARAWSPDPHDAPPRFRITPLTLAAGAAVFVAGALPHLLQPALRWRDDALLHIPVIQRVIAEGIPPGNPFLAGEPLAYFWFLHATLGGVASLSGLPLDWLPVLLNLQGLAVLLFAIDRAGRVLGLAGGARALALLFVGCGLTPWGWMRLVYLQQTRPDINWALVEASGVSGLFPILSPFDPRLVASLTKVTISNALPMSLAIFVLAATPTPRAPGRGVRQTLWVTGALLFHLATGILLWSGLALRWVLDRFVRRDEGAGYRDHLGALVLAGVFAAPYVLGILAARSGTSAAQLGFHPEHWFLLHLSLVGLWGLAAWVLPAWIRDPARVRWLAVGLPALALPLAVHLVDGNEYKTIFVWLLLLTLPAGAALAALMRRRGAVWLLMLALFLPTPYLAGRGYARDVPANFPTTAERAAAADAGAALPGDTVLVYARPGRGYGRLSAAFGKPAYLSDPYALQIMGQWDSPVARARRAPGSLPALLAAARRDLSPRPVALVLSAEELRRDPRMRGVPERMGWRPAVTTRYFTIYLEPDAPPSR